MANVDFSTMNNLSTEEIALHELLNSYGNESILPDKDHAAKLVLLRVFLKKYLLQIINLEPLISFKQTVLALVNLLPDNAREEAYHLVVEVVSRYWQADVSKNQKVGI